MSVRSVHLVKHTKNGCVSALPLALCRIKISQKGYLFVAKSAKMQVSYPKRKGVRPAVRLAHTATTQTTPPHRRGPADCSPLGDLFAPKARPEKRFAKATCKGALRNALQRFFSLDRPWQGTQTDPNAPALDARGPGAVWAVRRQRLQRRFGRPGRCTGRDTR